jgi:hypothetical protein
MLRDGIFLIFLELINRFRCFVKLVFGILDFLSPGVGGSVVGNMLQSFFNFLLIEFLEIELVFLLLNLIKISSFIWRILFRTEA